MKAVETYIKALQVPGREAERAAIASLLNDALGPGATLTHRPDGSPAINIPGIEISISHCRTCAVIVLADRPVGVDVETHRAQLARVAPRVLSPDELICYRDCLVKAWTLKEALYKGALTPGLDFRRDLLLPLDGSNTATVLTPQPLQFEILRSEPLDQYGAYISLVRRL